MVQIAQLAIPLFALLATTVATPVPAAATEGVPRNLPEPIGITKRDPAALIERSKLSEDSDLAKRSNPRYSVSVP